MGPLFSILHSTARPAKWREIYDAWIKAARHPETVEYVLCVDERWGFPRHPIASLEHDALWKFLHDDDAGAPGQARREGLNTLVWNDGRRCYVDGVNAAAANARGRILIVNADDQYPCDGWDAALLELEQEGESLGAALAKHPGLLLKDFVVEVSTGTPQEHARGILVMPILSRARYERLGYVFYPEYESMFADNEFCEHARQDRCILDARHLLFPHIHPLFDRRAQKPGVPWHQTDEAYEAQNRRPAYELGRAIFDRRKAAGFPPPVSGQQWMSPQGGKLADWFVQARSIQGWMSDEELKWLHATAATMASVAEIGCWKGRSTVALAAGCKGDVYAVDHFKGSNEPEHIAEIERLGGSTFPDFQANTESYPNIIPVQFSSVEAAGITPDVDMVFIDGAHDYESVRADLEAWKGKAKRLICGHDQDHPDVARAVRDVLGGVHRGPGGLWFQPAQALRTIALCLPGEYFRREWMRHGMLLTMHLMERGFQVAIADGYTSDPHVTRQQMLDGLAGLPLRDDDLLLWLDDDNILSIETFDLLLKDLDERPDIAGVAGWCWIHNEEASNFSTSCGEFTPDKLHWIPFNPREFPKQRAPRPMECGGFPCVLMRHSTIRKIGPNPFLPFLDERMQYGKSGEDMAFWMRADAQGLAFLVDPRAEVPHYKYGKFAPQFPEENAPVHTVACMMRVKNEARWITKSIESVRELCGQNIFVLEDGSSDNTPDLIVQAGARLIRSPFSGLPLDECRDKDYLMRYVVEACNPDWILCIDGDEALEPGGCQKILSYLKGNPSHDYIGLRFVNLWDGFDQARVDGVYGGMVRQSLFRPSPDLSFKSYYEHEGGRNHVGLHCGNTPYSPDFAAINVFLLHFGALYREDRIRKYRWMVSIDPQNEFEDGYRHMVQGDIPEVPADARLRHSGPLEVRKIPRRMVPRFDQEPGPARISGSALVEPGPLTLQAATMCKVDL